MASSFGVLVRKRSVLAHFGLREAIKSITISQNPLDMYHRIISEIEE